MASKDTALYWQNRITKRRINGKESTNYYARMAHQGRRAYINLDTGNASKAKNVAADKWSLLKAQGWDAVKPPRDETFDMTVGEYIKAAEKTKVVRLSTFQSYARKFRQLVSEIEGLSVSSRQAPNKAAEWQATVDKVKLSRITDERVLKWREKRLKDVSDSVSAVRASTTADSILRNARSLFGGKVAEKLTFVLSPVPLVGIKVKSMKPRSHKNEVDFDALNRDAATELPPDRYLVYLLASGCGLRRSEMDRLRRSDISITTESETITKKDGTEEVIEKLQGLIHITDTEDGQVKTEGSERHIPFNPSGALGKALEAAPLGFYVVSPNAKPLKVQKLGRYRCDEAFKAVTLWLRGKGIVNAPQPLHYLRKEFGSRIAKTSGIHVAAASLGNDIKIAYKAYIEKKAESLA